MAFHANRKLDLHEQIAIGLCHDAKIRTDDVCQYFDVSLRTISRFPNDFPEIVAALRLFPQIKMQQEDHERSMVISHDIIFDRQPRLMKRLEKARLILEIGHLKRKLKKTKLRLSSLEAKWRQSKFTIEEPSEASEFLADREEQSCVLQELVNLNQVHPQGRRYSQRLFCFVYCLLTYSPDVTSTYIRSWRYPAALRYTTISRRQFNN